MLPKIPRLDRRTENPVAPEVEDGGLFKGGVVQVQLALVPVFETTSRGDCSVRAFNAQGADVTVIFAGRRRQNFQPLYDQLRYMYAQAHYADAMRGIKMRDVNSIQLAVQCEGAWRARVTLDEYGRETRSVHFMVARWAFQAHDGQTLTYGAPPILQKKAPKPAPGEGGGMTAKGWPPASRQGAAYGR